MLRGKARAFASRAVGYPGVVVSLLLASASPARAATLRSAGIEPLIHASHIDEDAALTEATGRSGPLSVAQSVQVLAEAKAQAVAAIHPGAADITLGCDSLLELAGEGLGKPGDSGTARRRWQQMRGTTGTLHTGHFVITADGRTASETASTHVTFAHITDEEIDAYIATGEPLGVAGGFTIDSLGGPFITKIDGDYHAVVGLSLPLLRELLTRLGFSWPSLWANH